MVFGFFQTSGVEGLAPAKAELQDAKKKVRALGNAARALERAAIDYAAAWETTKAAAGALGDQKAWREADETLLQGFRVQRRRQAVTLKAAVDEVEALCNNLDKSYADTKRYAASKQALIRKLESASSGVLGGSKSTKHEAVRRDLELETDRFNMAYKHFDDGMQQLQAVIQTKLSKALMQSLLIQREGLGEAAQYLADHEEEHEALLRDVQDREEHNRQSEVMLTQENRAERGSLGLLKEEAFLVFSRDFVRPHKDLVPMFPTEETYLSIDDVVSVRGQSFKYGTIIATTYRLLFIEYGRRDASGVPTDPAVFLETYLGNIDNITKRKTSDRTVLLGTKDLQQFALCFQHAPDYLDCFYDHVKHNALAFDQNRFFPHRFSMTSSVDGWTVYDPLEEYHRLGVVGDRFVVSDVNRDYVLCDTYPSVIVVPASVKKEQLVASAKFRRKQRLPVVCWGSSASDAVLVRSSQPCVGLSRSRSSADETLVRAYGVQQAVGLVICDARPQANAVANIAKGGGWESIKAYNRTDFHFQNIANIHIMRSSLEGLRDLFNTHIASQSSETRRDASTSVDAAMEAVQQDLVGARGIATWFEHLQAVIQGGTQIASFLRDGTSVLSHCSDGWDRTSQLVALAQLLLDPFYRTRRGFAVLIEKEFLSFGHKFATRCGHGSSRDFTDMQRSPIFVQWLDVVYQLIVQFPDVFEFKSSFLLDIIDALHSSMFGTFLYDSEKERLANKVRGSTASAWSALFVPHHINPSFCPTTTVLEPDTRLGAFRIWTSLYVRWIDPTVSPPRFLPAKP